FSAGAWIDDAGNYWTVGTNGDILKVPLTGFDAQGNPRYSWSSMEVVVPFKDDDLDFKPVSVRPAANGEIYAMGNTNIKVGIGPCFAGDYVARYDANGNRLLLSPTPSMTPAAMAIDETDATPDYYYTGWGENDQQYINMFTNDGLLVTT